MDCQIENIDDIGDIIEIGTSCKTKIDTQDGNVAECRRMLQLWNDDDKLHMRENFHIMNTDVPASVSSLPLDTQLPKTLFNVT